MSGTSSTRRSALALGAAAIAVPTLGMATTAGYRMPMEADVDLISHNAAASPIMAVKATIDSEGRSWAFVRFRATGDIRRVVVPENAAGAERTDGLWQHTCFEIFAARADGTYAEFNISPSTRWAAYAFDGYRAGMRTLDGGVRVVRVAVSEDALEVDAILDWSNWPEVQRIGVSTVVEATDGTITYWALAHPSREPDFHNPASFTLSLPAEPA